MDMKEMSWYDADNLLPPFDQDIDDMYAYLSRFELHAKYVGWDPEHWTTYLLMSLTGEALRIVTDLSSEDASNYDKVKHALLIAFGYDAKGCLRDFRSARPQIGEYFPAFCRKMRRRYDRWLELEGVDRNDSQQIYDLMLKENFLNSCHPDLKLFLLDGEVKTFDAMMERAQIYAETYPYKDLGRLDHREFSTVDEVSPQNKESQKDSLERDLEFTLEIERMKMESEMKIERMKMESEMKIESMKMEAEANDKRRMHEKEMVELEMKFEKELEAERERANWASDRIAVLERQNREFRMSQKRDDENRHERVETRENVKKTVHETGLTDDETDRCEYMQDIREFEFQLKKEEHKMRINELLLETELKRLRIRELELELKVSESNARTVDQLQPSSKTAKPKTGNIFPSSDRQTLDYEPMCHVDKISSSESQYRMNGKHVKSKPRRLKCYKCGRCGHIQSNCPLSPTKHWERESCPKRYKELKTDESQNTKHAQNTNQETITGSHVNKSLQSLCNDPSRMRHHQLSDRSLKTCFAKLKSKQTDEISFAFHDNVLLRIKTNDKGKTTQLVVPRRYRHDILLKTRENAEHSFKEFRQCIVNKFYWPGMREHMFYYFKACHADKRAFQPSDTTRSVAV